jgi:hypothetical protein
MEAGDAGDAERWDIAVSRSSIKTGVVPAHCCCEVPWNRLGPRFWCRPRWRLAPLIGPTLPPRS